MVIVTNRSKQIKIYNLPHARFCTEAECHCKEVSTTLHAELPDGTRGLQTLERKLGSELTLLAGESKEMPDRVRLVPVVKRDLDRGVLRLVELPKRAPKPEKPKEKTQDEQPKPERTPRQGQRRESVKE